MMESMGELRGWRKKPDTRRDITLLFRGFSSSSLLPLSLWAMPYVATQSEHRQISP